MIISKMRDESLIFAAVGPALCEAPMLQTRRWLESETLPTFIELRVKASRFLVSGQLKMAKVSVLYTILYIYTPLLRFS